MIRSAILGLVVLGALWSAGVAQAASCEPTLFPQSLASLAIAQVKAQKAPVFRDPEACSRPTGLCPSKAYLVAGDRVVTAQVEGGYRCVAFLGPKRMTIGWVDATALAPVPAGSPGKAWAGTWERQLGDASLQVTRKGGGYFATLSASASGAAPGDVRTGGADGVLVVKGDRAEVTNQGDPTCKVTLRRLDGLIIVNDGASDEANSPCGGMGVTLNGVYRQTARR